MWMEMETSPKFQRNPPSISQLGKTTSFITFSPPTLFLLSPNAHTKLRILAGFWRRKVEKNGVDIYNNTNTNTKCMDMDST